MRQRFLEELEEQKETAVGGAKRNDKPSRSQRRREKRKDKAEAMGQRHAGKASDEMDDESEPEGWCSGIPMFRGTKHIYSEQPDKEMGKSGIEITVHLCLTTLSN